MALRNFDRSDYEDNEEGNRDSTGGGQDKGAKSGKAKERVRPNQHGEDNDNLFEDNDTGALV